MESVYGLSSPMYDLHCPGSSLRCFNKGTLMDSILDFSFTPSRSCPYIFHVGHVGVGVRPLMVVVIELCTLYSLVPWGH